MIIQNVPTDVIVVNNEQAPLVVTVGSDAMAPLVLSAAATVNSAADTAVAAAATAAASAAEATQALSDLTAILAQSMSSENVIYRDRVTQTLYRLVLINGQLLKEEVDPNTVLIVGNRGYWGILTGL